jgi:hypothetical protein
LTAVIVHTASKRLFCRKINISGAQGPYGFHALVWAMKRSQGGNDGGVGEGHLKMESINNGIEMFELSSQRF